MGGPDIGKMSVDLMLAPTSGFSASAKKPRVKETRSKDRFPNFLSYVDGFTCLFVSRSVESTSDKIFIKQAQLF